MEDKLSHIDDAGNMMMVDVSDKEITKRIAVASGKIFMKQSTLDMIKKGEAKKGDVLACSRLAGIMSAKKTGDLIPMCHPLNLENVAIDFDFVDSDNDMSYIKVMATCILTGKTGVEMEAMTSVSVACLTIYDMCKAVDRFMKIDAVQLEKKDGGKSGLWQREQNK